MPQPKPTIKPSPELAIHALRAIGAPVREDFRKAAIDYIDIKPKPFVAKIAFAEFVERVKRIKLDDWQVNFCDRLQAAAEGRHIETTRAIIHAEAQLGKSIILVQCYSAWILGHDPMHRIALATYNVSRSQAHSAAVISIMNLPVYRQIFPDADCHVSPNASKEKWKTAARRSGTDAQDSFNPVGLQSGLTGSGFDTLLIDDPYAKEKDAFSEQIRANLLSFWEADVSSRIGLYANVFGMFHRYHHEDLAGYLLSTDTFDYWRYASVADGPFVDTETGKKYDDPLGREIGQYISPVRRPPVYYTNMKKNKRVWNSMFQGRPSAEEGEFFNVGKLHKMTAAETEQFRSECSIIIRAWDMAATEEGGDHSVGFNLGMRPDKSAGIFDVKRKQVDTAGRDVLQRETAINDGVNTVITIPQDPGAAGKSVVHYVQQKLQEFTVVPRATSGSKEDRARNGASAVNSGDVYIASDDHLPDEEKWVKELLREFRNFPLSEHDDIVDSFADAYNEAFERISRGSVIKNFKPASSLITWAQFARRFENGKPAEKIPKHWTIYAGVKVTADASRPNAAVITARAPHNSKLDDTIFVVAEYKEYTDDPAKVFEWLDAALEAYCENGKLATIWLHPESSSYRQAIWQKLNVPVAIFEGDEKAGIAELDWYCLPRLHNSTFDEQVKATGFYALIADPAQLSVATNEYGLSAMRQEFATWNLDDKSEPTKIAAVLDCLRLVTYCFRTSSTPLNRAEKIEDALAPALRTESIQQVDDPILKTQLLQRRMLETQRIEQEVDKPIRGPHASRFRRR